MKAPGIAHCRTPVAPCRWGRVRPGLDGRLGAAVRLLIGGLSICLLPASAPARDAAVPPAAAPSQPVERVLLVPFDEVHAVLEGDPRRVWMSRRAYEDLRDRARRIEAGEPPVGAVVVDADYRVAVSNERAVIRGVLTVEALKPGVQAAVLPFSGAGLMAADLDGRPAALAATNGALRILVEGPSRGRLTVEAVAPVAMTAARQTLHLELPVPASARMRLTVAGDVDVQAGAAVVWRRFDEAANRTEFDLLPRRGPMTLVMSLNSRLKSRDRAVIVRSVLVDEIAPAVERLRAALTFDIQRRPVAELRVAMPEAFEVTDAVSPHVTAWSVEAGEGGRRTLVLRLRAETMGVVVVHVKALRVKPDLAAWRMPVPRPLGVDAHVAIVGVRADRVLELGEVAPSGLIAVDLGVIGEALPVTAGDGLRTVLAFYAPSPDFALSAACRPVPPSVLLTANYVLTAADAGLTVNGGLALLPRREKLFALDLRVPAGWRLTRAAMAGGAPLPYEIYADATGGAARAQIRFPQGLPADRDAGVEFSAERVPAGWAGAWTVREEPFPGFRVDGVTRERGALAVNAADDLAVRPGRLDGVYPLDENRKESFGLGGVATSLAYAYEAHPYTVTMKVERRVPRLTAETYGFCRVLPAGLDLRYEIVYAVADARVREVSFSLPTNTPAAAAVTGVGETGVKESSSSIEKGRRVWRVKLADARAGSVHIAAELVVPAAAAGGSSETPVPDVRAEGVEYQSGWVAVEGWPELDVTPVRHPRAVDVGEMVDAQYRPGRRLLGAYSFVGDPVPVVLRVERRPGAFMPPAVVQRVELATLLSAEGRSQSALRLTLRGGVQLLDVRLPEGATLWAASIDGTPARPRREGDRTLLSLPPRADAALVDVRLIYESPVVPMRVWSRPRMEAPLLYFYGEDFAQPVPVPMADMRWDVYVPEGYRAVGSGGTLQAMSSLSPEPAAGRLARWLYRFSGGVNPRHGLVGGCVRMAGCGTLAAYSVPRGKGTSVVATLGMEENVQLESAGGIVGGRVAEPARTSSALAMDVAGTVQSGAAFGYSPQPADVPSAPDTQHPASGKPTQVVWAMEGLSSLEIELARVGTPLGFVSLGDAPRLTLRVLHTRRVEAAAWALALGALLAGRAIARRRPAGRWAFVGGVLAVAMALPLAPGLEELVLVCNPVFYAAAWLAAAYAGASVWRTARGGRRAPVSAVAPLLLAVALCAPSSAAGAAEGGAPAAPAACEVERPLPLKVPADALVAPYRPEIGAAEADQVLVPYDAFVRMTSLVARASASASPTSPVPVAVGAAVCTATLSTGTHLTVGMTLPVDVFTDAPVTLPIQLAGAVLASAALDGGPAPLGAGGGLAVCLRGRGRHALDLAVRVPIARHGGWRAVEARLPAVPAARLTLHVPEAGSEIQLLGSSDRVLWKTQRAGERIETALAADGGLRLRWRAKTVEGDSASALTAAGEALLDIREDQVRVVWRATLAFRGGERSAFTALIPAGYLLEKVEGENVRGWALADEAERAAAPGAAATVGIELLRPVSAETALTFHLWRPMEDGGRSERTFASPAVRFPGAVREPGRISVRRSPLLEVRTLRAPGLQRADWPGAADELAALISESPLGSAAHEAYEFASADAALELRVRPVAAGVSASVQALYKLAPDAATLEARVELDVSSRVVHAVVLRTPGWMKVDEVAAAGLAEWVVREGASTHEVFLQFERGVAGRVPVLVRMSSSRGQIEAAGDLPRVEVEGAARQTGWVVLQTEPGFDVHTRDLAGIETAPLREAHGWLSEPQRALARVALRYHAPGYGGRVEIVRRQPDVRCYTVTNIRITDRAIEETVLLAFNVRNAGVRQLRFVLPDALASARIRVPYLREKRMEPDGSGGVEVTADLQDEILGEIKVLVEQDRLFTGGRQTVRLPRVLAGQVSRQYVTLENAGRDELAVESHQGLDPLEREQREWKVVEPLMRGGMGQAFMAGGGGPEGASLVFAARQRPEVRTAGGRIGLAQCTLVLDGAGAYRGEQVYHIDNQTEQFLDIELPPGASLWSAVVAGEPVKPVTGAAGASRRVRVPLVKTAPGDVDYAIALTYGGAAGDLPAAGAFEAPLMRTLNVNVELSQLEVRLPRSHRWLHFGGTMREVLEQADFEAGKLAYKSGLARRLVRSLQYGGVFEKARAAANLKSVSKDLQDYNEYAQKTYVGDNLSLNTEAANAAGIVAEAQRQLDAAQVSVGAVGADNRGWMNAQFTGQMNTLSRGDDLNTRRNWDESALGGEKDQPAKRQGGDGFKLRSYWGTTSGKESKEGDRDGREGGPDEPAAQSVNAAFKAGAIVKSPVALKQAGRKGAGDWEGDALRQRGDRRGGQQELAARYQKRLEVEKEAQDQQGQPAQQQAQPSADPYGADDRTDQAGIGGGGEEPAPVILRGIYASRSPGARGSATARPSEVTPELAATGLAGLPVELPSYDPQRWELRRFVTPRGDAGVRAYGWRMSAEQRVKRLLALLVAALVVAGAARMVRLGLRTEAVQRIAPPAMIFAGGVGLFVGVFPVAGVVLVLVGVILRRSLVTER